MKKACADGQCLTVCPEIDQDQTNQYQCDQRCAWLTVMLTTNLCPLKSESGVAEPDRHPGYNLLGNARLLMEEVNRLNQRPQHSNNARQSRLNLTCRVLFWQKTRAVVANFQARLLCGVCIVSLGRTCSSLQMSRDTDVLRSMLSRRLYDFFMCGRARSFKKASIGYSCNQSERPYQQHGKCRGSVDTCGEKIGHAGFK